MGLPAEQLPPENSEDQPETEVPDNVIDLNEWLREKIDGLEFQIAALHEMVRQSVKRDEIYVRPEIDELVRERKDDIAELQKQIKEDRERFQKQTEADRERFLKLINSTETGFIDSVVDVKKSMQSIIENSKQLTSVLDRVAQTTADTRSYVDQHIAVQSERIAVIEQRVEHTDRRMERVEDSDKKQSSEIAFLNAVTQDHETRSQLMTTAVLGSKESGIPPLRAEVEAISDTNKENNRMTNRLIIGFIITVVARMFGVDLGVV